MYNYLEDVIDSVKQAIKDYYTADEIRANLADRDAWAGRLNDDLWADDSVTGNGSGSYTFSRWEAEENLTHNWELLEEALTYFGEGENPIRKGAEWCDVLIRCYLLDDAISEALDELEEEYPEEDEEETEEADD